MTCQLRFSPLLVLCALLGISNPSNAQQTPDQLFSSAVDAQQRGDYAVAIRDYEKLLQSRPNMGEARANLGAALAQTGRLDDAIAQYKLALPIAPDKDGVRLNLGLAYYKIGRSEIIQSGDPKDPKAMAALNDAVLQFQELRKVRPRDPQVAILLGDSEVRLSRPSEAAAMLLPLEPENAANPDFEYTLAEAQIAAGARREGAHRMEKVAQATQSADAYQLAGSTLIDLNELEAGRRDLEEVIKLQPDWPHIYSMVGVTLDKNGDQDGAVVAFREALRRDPNDFTANLNLGAILFKRRDVEAAKPFLDKALQLNPKDSMARYESAMYDSTTGQYDDAARLLESVVKTDPDWLEPHVALATVYYRIHRPEDGAKEREMVARITAQQQTKGPGTPSVDKP
jgi:tetratricopeptide (TPR) repeat protein